MREVMSMNWMTPLGLGFIATQLQEIGLNLKIGGIAVLYYSATQLRQDTVF
jgi:hypothetical protein